MSLLRRVFFIPRPAVPRRPIIWSLAALLLMAVAWTLAIGWWLPRFLQPRIEAQASSALGAPLTLEALEIAPWRLQARAAGLRLGPAEAPWLRVAELRADISLESLWRFAPVLQRLVVREPQLELERIDAHRFNITPMLEALAKRPPAPAGAEPERFALHNIRLQDGRIHFVDRLAHAEHRVEALQIGIPFLSNLPSQVAVDVEPLLDAQVDGSRLRIQGRTRPFSEGLRSIVDVSWQQLDVPRWLAAAAPLMSQALPLSAQSGQLDLALQVAFERRGAPAPASLHITGGATLSRLQATVPAHGVQLAWERLALEGLDLRPLEHQASVEAVTLQAPQAEIDLPRFLGSSAPAASHGKNHLVLDPPAAAASTAAARAQDAAGPWRWRVARLGVADGRLMLRDPAWPQGRALAPIQLKAAGLDGSLHAPAATLVLSAADADGARVQVDGTLDVAARSANMKLDAAGLKPASWLGPWQAQLPVRVLDGSVALEAQLQAAADGWSLRDGHLELGGVQLQPTTLPAAARQKAASTVAGDRLNLAKLEASGVQASARDGEPLSAQVDALRFENLNLQATRGESGALPWLPPPRATTANDGAAAPGDAKPQPRWQIGELRCSACGFAFTDLGVKHAAALAFTRTDLVVRKLDSDPQQPMTFELAALAGRGGRLKLQGDARVQPLALRSRVELAALDLSALQPYLDPYVNITLASARADAAGDLRVDGNARETVSSVRWRGRLALNELRALDRLNAADLARIKAMSLDGADIGWRPDGVVADLGIVSLDNFYGRVILNADARLNLRDIVRRPQEAAPLSVTTPTSQAPGASAPAAAASTPAGAPAQLRWQAIRLSKGEVDFTDNFIRPNYSARLTDIAGEVSALAWNDPKPATVGITGKVDGDAPLEVGGTLHPLGARLYTDITASARGIDLTRLTAYAGRYAGYGIEKGTLSAKVRYKVENGKLEAENNLYLDQLTFGAKVDSPDALKLPVLLAVSLLKDRNGVIDVNLPVSGSLDDPQFSLGGIIVRVIVNLIAKAVTAPFTLLANAFGGSAQELGYVEFETGSAELDAASTQRLDTLAKALNDRPSLKLEATGRADPMLDAEGLRRAHVESLMRAAKAKATGDLPDGVKIGPGERDRWLEAAYKAADIKGKPRNLIGLQKGLPAPEMEALLMQSATVNPDQLKALADRRSDNVKAYLAAKVAPERVLLTASLVGADGLTDKGRTTRVAFSLK